MQDLKEFVDGPVDPICRSGSSATCFTSPASLPTRARITSSKEMLQKVDNDHATHGNYFYYLATAPDFFGPIVQQLSATG